MQNKRWVCVPVLLLFAFAPLVACAQEDEELPVAMRDIYTQLQVLLPLSVREGALTMPENHARVVAALSRLVERADSLTVHTSLVDPGARFLGGQLAENAERALKDVRLGSSESAEFFVRHLTDACVRCHARLPADDSPITRGFADENAFAGLDPFERGRLLIATRRFDEALDAFETGFEEWTQHSLPWGPMSDYLTVAVRVKRAPQRAMATLEKLQKRPLGDDVRADLEAWTADLRSLETMSFPVDLSASRREFDENRKAKTYGFDRRFFVRYLAVSSRVHQALEAKRVPQQRLADAYLLLGEAELEISRYAWASPALQYLELAIHSAVDKALAHRAFDLYEQEIVAGYSGSSGTHIPQDVREHMEELRSMAYPQAAPEVH